MPLHWVLPLHQTTMTTTSEDPKDNYGAVNAIPQSPLLRTLSSRLGSKGHSVVGIVLILLGAFAFSCMFLFVKFMEGKANTFILAWYRAWVEIPIALFLCWQDKENPLGSPEARGWLWVRGGMGGAAVICFFYAIQHLPLPDAVTLQFTTPPFAAAFAVCLARERWMVLDQVGAVVCLAGVMLIAHPSWLFGSDPTDDEANQQQKDSLVPIAVALTGAAFAGMAYMSVRKIGHRASANVMVLYYGAFSIPLVLLGSKMLRGQWNVWSEGRALFSPLDISLIILTGLSAYAGQYLINLGLQHETAATGTLATCK